MGYPKKEPSGRWRAVLWNRLAKKKEYVSLPVSTKTKRQAKRETDRLQDALDRGILGLQGESSKRFVKSWLEVAADVLAEVEVRNGRNWLSPCKAFVERFAIYVGDIPADRVTPRKCRDYVLERERSGYSPSTIRKEVFFLRRVFNRCVEDGHLEENPWAGIRPPREPRRAPNYLTEDELKRLLAAAPADRSFRYLLLATTGARPKEAMGLRWADIDLRSRAIMIPNSSKGGPPRYPYRRVPIQAALRGELKRRRRGRSDFVLKGRNNWRRDLLLDAKAAGLGVISIYWLRHTFACLMAQRGVPLLRIRDLMGHASITTTEIYAHLSGSLADEDEIDFLG